jgi:hypothetical protein
MKMNLLTLSYSDYEKGLPQQGNHILAQQTKETIIVYQAYHPGIADYAVAHQQFGGSQYSFNRMSWIKPNFLWMMYRCGWAQKENQERVLAIELRKTHFDEILSRAVHTSFKKEVYEHKEDWTADLKKSEVRVQWDPDHDPKGGKHERRAIQLGLKGETLRQFATDWIVAIEDITPFVLEQFSKLKAGDLSSLEVAAESVYQTKSEAVKAYLMLD